MEGGSQQICRFFRAGNCKYGSKCKFSHQQSSSTSMARQPTPEDVIINDLGKRPIWELSCYGLNISWETGRNILNSDVSPEELRLEAYAQNMMLGNIAAYLETLARTREERLMLVKRILDDPSAAVQIARSALVQPDALGSSVSQGSLALSSDQISLAAHQILPTQSQVAQPVPPHVATPQAPSRSAFQFGQIPDLPPP